MPTTNSMGLVRLEGGGARSRLAIQSGESRRPSTDPLTENLAVHAIVNPQFKDANGLLRPPVVNQEPTHGKSGDNEYSQPILDHFSERFINSVLDSLKEISEKTDIELQSCDVERKLAWEEKFPKPSPFSKQLSEWLQSIIRNRII